jgi:hypothetical protein
LTIGDRATLESRHGLRGTTVLASAERIAHMTRVVLGAIVAVLIALLVGWIWGASGKSALGHALEASELRMDLVESRGAVQSARVDLYNNNFGEASRHLGEARELVTRATALLETLGRAGEEKALAPVSASIDDAQRLAGKLDQGAQSRAADAVKLIDAALESSARR